MVVIRSPAAAPGPSVLQHHRGRQRDRRDGRFIERLGFYNPSAKESEEGLRIAQDRPDLLEGRRRPGTDTVERLIKQLAKKAA
jgi:small subunit ribosomal protein S16